MGRTQASVQLDNQIRLYQQKVQLVAITPEEERRVTPATIKILLLYTVLSLAASDIKFEFDQVGLYRQKTKRTINEVEGMVVQLFNRLRRRLKEDNPDSVKKYDNINLYVCDKVAEAILLAAPERSVNIALASCRLMLRFNDELERFCVLEVMPLGHVIRKLGSLPVKDYCIDGIIERTISKLMQL